MEDTYPMSNAITKSEAMEQLLESIERLRLAYKSGGLLKKEIVAVKDAIENLEMAVETSDTPKPKGRNR